MNKSRRKHAVGSLTVMVAALLATTAATPENTTSNSLDDCAAPAGSTQVFHTYADGVQIYRWNGTSWTFIAPSAVLYMDAGGNGAVGVHYAGPTWMSVSGSKVVGTVNKRCPVDPNSIPWLLLDAVAADGPGIFDRVTHIRRVNTVGGNAPATPGNFVGEELQVHYTAEYFFYRL